MPSAHFRAASYAQEKFVESKDKRRKYTSASRKELRRRQIKTDQEKISLTTNLQQSSAGYFKINHTRPLSKLRLFMQKLPEDSTMKTKGDVRKCNMRMQEFR